MRERHGEFVTAQMAGDSRTIDDLADELSKELGRPLSRFVIARFRANGWEAGTPRLRPPAGSTDVLQQVAELRGRVEALENMLGSQLRNP